MVDLTSNDLFGRAIWDKLPEYIFENFEIPRAIQGQFRIFENPEGDLFQELPKWSMWFLVNQIKPKNIFYWN